MGSGCQARQERQERRAGCGVASRVFASFPGARPTHSLALPSSTGAGLHPHYHHCYLGGVALSGRVGNPRGVGQTCVLRVSSELIGSPSPLSAWPVFPLRTIFGLRIHSLASHTTSVAGLGLCTFVKDVTDHKTFHPQLELWGIAKTFKWALMLLLLNGSLSPQVGLHCSRAIENNLICYINI